MAYDVNDVGSIASALRVDPEGLARDLNDATFRSYEEAEVLAARIAASLTPEQRIEAERLLRGWHDAPQSGPLDSPLSDAHSAD